MLCSQSSLQVKVHKPLECSVHQKISNKRFSNVLQKSITSSFSSEEIVDFKSDFVISNATIEHVGSLKNQKKMVENMIKLTNKVMIIQTINRFFPIDTHTKLPLLNMLPKAIHRKIKKFLARQLPNRQKN